MEKAECGSIFVLIRPFAEKIDRAYDKGSEAHTSCIVAAENAETTFTKVSERSPVR